MSARRRDLQDMPTVDLVRIARDRQRVVYGSDDRKDLYDVKNSKVQLVSQSVAALVKASDLVPKAGGFRLRTASYQEEYGLCGSERFASQPIACFCSGFLVAPDVIATAGHCVESKADLDKIRFVFGFRMKNAETAYTEFGVDDVYAGRKSSDGVTPRATPTGPSYSSTGLSSDVRRSPSGAREEWAIRRRCSSSAILAAYRRSMRPARKSATIRACRSSSRIWTRTAATRDRPSSTPPPEPWKASSCAAKPTSCRTGPARCPWFAQRRVVAAKT